MNQEIPSSDAVASLEQVGSIEAIEYQEEEKEIGILQAKLENDALHEEHAYLQYQLNEATSTTNDDTFLWTFVVVIFAAVLFYISPY